MVMENDVLIGAVLHAEPSGNDPQLDETQLPVQRKSRSVGADNRVELKDPETQLLPLRQTVADKSLADMAAPAVTAHRVAGVADMTAAPDIVGMKNIETRRSRRTPRPQRSP